MFWHSKRCRIYPRTARTNGRHNGHDNDDTELKWRSRESERFYRGLLLLLLPASVKPLFVFRNTHALTPRGNRPIRLGYSEADDFFQVPPDPLKSSTPHDGCLLTLATKWKHFKHTHTRGRGRCVRYGLAISCFWCHTPTPGAKVAFTLLAAVLPARWRPPRLRDVYRVRLAAAPAKRTNALCLVQRLLRERERAWVSVME